MAADQYIFDPIETDTDVLQQEAFDYIKSRWPDWTPDEGNLEAWLIAACARMIGEARDVASAVPPAIFKYYGKTVIGLEPITARPSYVNSTWTFLTNPAGRDILENTLVAIPDADGNTVAFEVVSTVHVDTPTLTTPADSVVLRSIQDGAFTKGLGYGGLVVEPIDRKSWMDTVTLSTSSSGGQDDERDLAYLNRLSRRLRRQGGGIVLPRDFAAAAAEVAEENGVEALTLPMDGFNPADGTSNNEKTVTVVMRDAATGVGVPGPIKTLTQQYLAANREVNFNIHVEDPDGPYQIDVTFAGKVIPGADPPTVEAAAEAAVADFLASATWGIVPGSGAWRNLKIVRLQDLTAVLNNVDGFDYWTTLTVGLHGGSLASADYTMSGYYPVAAPGTIAGTMTT